ncbi:hypothetical protein C100_08850 [Sphingobium sp. C100]|nr:hypothetical protein C100_08850 [Sphingobium sp. C100]
MRKIQNDADALEDAAGGFRYFEPDWRKRLDHAGAVHLAYRLLADFREDVLFEAGQPLCVMSTVPAFAQRLMTNSSRGFEVGHDLSRLPTLGDWIEALSNTAA